MTVSATKTKGVIFSHAPPGEREKPPELHITQPDGTKKPITIPHTQHCNIKPTNRKENHGWTVQRGPGPVVVKRKPPKRSATQRTPHTLHLRRSLSSSQNSSTTRGARETGATTAGAVRWNLPCPSLLAFIPLVFRFELREGACGMPTPVLKSPTTSARALALAHLDAADDGAATAGNDSDDV
jgi:hypothetical protein